MKKYNSFLGAFFSGDNGQGGYNAAYGKSALAKLAMPDIDEQTRSEAIGGLARVDPATAMQFTQQQQKAAQERQMAQARMLAAAPVGERPKLYAAILPGLKKDWAEAPDIYTSELDSMVQAWAGNSGQQAPAKVQEAQYFANAAGYKPGTPEYTQFITQYSGVVGKGGKMSVAADGTPFDAENFRLYRDGKWIDIRPNGAGQIPPAGGDVQGFGQPISLEQINEVGARMRRDGGSVEEVNAWKDQQYANWELANGMGNSGAIGVAPAPSQGIPQSPEAPRPAVGNSRPLFAKPGWQLATPEQKRAMGIPENVPAQIGPDGKIDPISLPGSDKAPSIANETTIRKEFASQVKPYQDVISAYSRVESAANNPSAGGDMSMIFAYMKMLDPGSVVREGEFANAQNAAGVPDQVVNMYNRLRTGQRLNPAQRADFLNQARKLKINAEKSYKAYEQQYTEIAKQYEIPVERIIVGPSRSNQGGSIDFSSPDPLGILK